MDELARGSAIGRRATSNFPATPGLAGPLDAAVATKELPPLVPGCRRKVREWAIGSAHWPASAAYPAAWTGWGPPASPDTALGDLSAAAARMLAARDGPSDRFCHTVTAPSDVRLILPELPVETADSQRVRDLAGGRRDRRGAGCTSAMTTRANRSTPLSSALGPRAVEYGDERVIKLAEAAIRELRRTGDETVLVTADRFHEQI